MTNYIILAIIVLLSLSSVSAQNAEKETTDGRTLKNKQSKVKTKRDLQRGTWRGKGKGRGKGKVWGKSKSKGYYPSNYEEYYYG